MSDHCYSELTCRTTDQAVFEQLGFMVAWDAPRTENPDVIELEQQECNYAAYDDLHALAATGVPFYGSHTSGGDYLEGCFAAADGLIAWPDCLNGTPAARVLDTGAVVDEDLQHIQQYYDLRTRAEALINTPVAALTPEEE